MAAKIKYGSEIKGYAVDGRHFADLTSARKYAAKKSADYFNAESSSIVYIGFLVSASNGYTVGIGEHPTKFGWVKIADLGKGWKMVYRAPNKQDSRVINGEGKVIGKLTTSELRML